MTTFTDDKYDKNSEYMKALRDWEYQLELSSYHSRPWINKQSKAIQFLIMAGVFWGFGGCGLLVGAAIAVQADAILLAKWMIPLMGVLFFLIPFITFFEKNWLPPDTNAKIPPFEKPISRADLMNANSEFNNKPFKFEGKLVTMDDGGKGQLVGYAMGAGRCDEWRFEIGNGEIAVRVAPT